MKEWRERLDQQLSLLVEEGTLTVEYKNAVLVQGFLERFIETVGQEEREKVVEELKEEFSEWSVPDEVRYSKPLFYINEILDKYLSKKGEKK